MCARGAGRECRVAVVAADGRAVGLFGDARSACGTLSRWPDGPHGPYSPRYLPGTMILETTWSTPTGWLEVRVRTTACAGPGAMASFPAVLEPLAGLLDAGRPDPQHVVVGTLVVAAQRAVAKQVAHLGSGLGAQRRDVLLGLAAGRLPDALEPRPREVLHPGGVAAV